MTIPKPKHQTPIILSASSISSLPTETFPNPSTHGGVTWKTLISAPKTATDSLVVGIATCAPGTSGSCGSGLKPHRHSHAEVYWFKRGKGTVSIDGVRYAVGEGSVVWTPGDAEHGVENEGVEELEWVYAFAADGFGDVVYRFGEGEVKAKL